MSGEINGTNVLIKIESPASSGTYVVLGSQGDLEVEHSTETFDKSSKESRAKRVGAGRYSSSCRVRALYIPGNAEYAVLKDAMVSGTLVKVRRTLSGAEIEEADAVVTRLPESFPDQGAAEVNVELEVDGLWAAV